MTFKSFLRVGQGYNNIRKATLKKKDCTETATNTLASLRFRITCSKLSSAVLDDRKYIIFSSLPKKSLTQLDRTRHEKDGPPSLFI